MPLLHRKAFIRQKPPADLRPDEEVFLCKITHEIFRTYDEFFERTILCNSLVWSCALTGRAGLTYLEALESEQRARQSLRSFPRALLMPLLHLAALSRRGRLVELCEDVFTFIKDRFFPGEVVDVSRRSGVRHVCEILEVHSPYSSANGVASANEATGANGHAKPAHVDTIIISDSDEEDDAFQSPVVHVKGKKKSLSPSVFKYTVRMTSDEHSEPFTVKANQISRRKSTLSREKLKLLYKQHCEPQRGFIILKSSTVKKYQLSEQTFSQFFPDEPPQFPFSSPSSNSGGYASPAQASLSPLQAMEEKLKLLQKREEMAAAAQDKARLKKEREGAQEAKRREREDKDRLKEEQRKRFEEEKQRKKEEKERRKLEKEKEREKLKEEKKKYAQRLKLLSKPREDMECEDLKELPSPVPVRTRVPPNLFGEALMILEFLRAFGEAFDLKDEFPDGITLEVLEEALVGSDPEGPLCELLFFFLTAIFQALDEEQEELKDQAEDLWDALDDESDPTQSALSAVASLAAAWPQLHQGSSLKQLDLDSCTLSEILRLHILASGADSNHGNAKFRYQKQGGFTVMDDPCVELRLAEPALLKKLSSSPVYDLTAEEKLKILKALVGKLLTLASSRDLIEDCVEEQKAMRQELREIRAEQHRRGREEAAHRVRLRKEEKLREQELRMKEKEEKLKEQESVDRLPTNGETTAGYQAEVHNEEPPPSCKKEMKGDCTAGREQMSVENKPLPPPTMTKKELEKEQEKVRELQERIQKAASCTCLLPLGRDRMYRRYWILPSASALFVEDDSFGLTEDMLRPRPKPSENGEGDSVAEEGTTESVTSSPAPSYGDTLPVNRPNVWSFYSSIEEVDQLIEALNPRGHRESSLKEALLQDRERLQQLLSTCDCSKYTCTGEPEGSKAGPEGSAAAESMMEARLRDLLLDLEDRVHQGTLGSLKVLDRQVWRTALETANYELLGTDGRECVRVNGQVEAMEVDSTHLRSQTALCGISGSGTPQVVSSSVRILSQALADIEQGIERRFLKPPLGEEDSKKEHKMKKNKKKEEDQASDDGGSDSGRVVKTVLDRWKDSLQACSSLSQVFVHLSSLERSILWSRSILNARCRICRRKGDADNMLLCDSCERGHHTHCLRPRLKSVPEGDWFCPDCRPKQRSSRIPSRQRSSIDEEEEESEEEVEEEDSEEEEDSDDEDEDDEEEEEEVVENSRKSQALPPKSKTQSAPSKVQQTTPKNSSLPSGKTSKSSGKKATPPKTKSNTGKAPPRSGRTSARLSHENSTPTSRAKTSPGQSDTHKKMPTDSAPSKPSRAILSPSDPSSSSRRSSGRNQGVHELSACEQLTVELVRHEDSWPFMKLVSKTQVPDYYDIIKKPIALSIIREKVNNCQYQSTGEFICDVELMFSNCLQYNPRHTNEAKAGVRLQQFFHAQLSSLGLLERSSAPPTKRPRH